MIKEQKKLGLVVAFMVMWIVPLFLPTETWSRWALEELRVLVTGFLLGVWYMTDRGD
jgi:hypothetical protein